MTPRSNSIAITFGILLIISSSIFISGCGGGSSAATTVATPAVSLSTASLTFTSQTVGTPSAAQTVTVNSTGTATLGLSGIVTTGDFAQTNNCSSTLAPGVSCSINIIFTPTASGTRTGTLTVTDSASNSPQTVSLSGTSSASTVSLSTSSLNFATQVMVGTPSATQAITLNNTGATSLTITSIVASAGYTETDNCDGSLSGNSTCTINVTFTPTVVGALPGTLIITDNSNGVAGTTQTITLSGAGFTNNAVAVNVNFGPNGNLGPPTATTTSYYNGIFTTVTVCTPGSSTCTTIPNVLVDTGSEGLRILSNQLGNVSLPPITDSSGNVLYECVQYGDLSYNWGPMEMATVQIGGETATQLPGAAAGTGIPIQVIAAGAGAPLQVLNGNTAIATPCSANGGPSDNSVAALGANGILGIGNFAQDCGSGCTTSPAQNPNYILCTSTGSSCALTGVPLSAQAWNPVSAFNSADTNGVVLQLPSIPAAGSPPVAGTLVFGIGTQTCPGSPPGCLSNNLGASQLYALDPSGNFASILFNGVTYSSANTPGYLDSGSQALYVLDAATLGISDCTIGTTNIFLYCPGSTVNFANIGVTGFGGVGSGTVSISIANALSLFGANSSFAAFNNVGGDSGTAPANDNFDFGLPFFFGRNVYVGIEATTPPNGASAPNGYFAF
ncbi:MAG TPA: DUF3443 family protein [Terriglobia bacterium]|nr:DUF3443 family protein [Terriglobia bacterium]